MSSVASFLKTFTRLRALSLLAVALLFCTSARAALEIEITQGVEAGIPIAVVPFEWKGSGVPPHFVSDIVEADLKRSGRFDAIPRGDFLSQPHDHTQVNYKDWRLIKAEAKEGSATEKVKACESESDTTYTG